MSNINKSPEGRRPRLLDLFCCAGGASLGYYQAGFDVIGVDIKPQPRYPFQFIQADAMTVPLHGFEAIHASPPCQAYSRGAVALRNQGKQYPDLLGKTRVRLVESGIPWVIENVPSAPMRADFLLCGSQFGLRVIRHRLFEVSWGPLKTLSLDSPCAHDKWALSVTGSGTPSWKREARVQAGMTKNYTIAEVREVMQIPHASRSELSQAIPPAYTKYIGNFLTGHLREIVA